MRWVRRWYVQPMLMGHYSAAFAASSADRSVPLWVSFIAVQLVDIFWSIFILIGVEKLRLVDGLPSNPFDLYYVPYTHSLVGTIAFAILGALIFKALSKATWKAAAIVGLAVLSHFLLDLIVHRPDMTLAGGTSKLGWGLWNYPIAAYLLEVGLLLGTIWLYVRKEAVDAARAKRMWIFGVVMVAILANFYFGVHIPSVPLTAALSFVSFLGLAGAAWWLDRPPASSA